MNIIFFGNGKFAQKSLERLHSDKLHNVLLVVTNDLKKQGRGLSSLNTPIANYCESNNINLFKTNNIKNKENINLFSNYNADVFIVIEYKILPDYIYSIPKNGSINIHASLLPKYRGAAPIQRAIMNGDTKIGVSSFKLNNNIDGGKIICTKHTVFNDKSTYGEVYDTLSVIGSELLFETLDAIEKNKQLCIQEVSAITKAPKIEKNDFRITFNCRAKDIHNKIRALTPPSPFAFINNKKIKLFNTYYLDDNKLSVGEYNFSNKSIYIGCKYGTLIVEFLQFENKRKISALDFSNMKHLKLFKFE